MDTILSNSILYRSTQKYFDDKLKEFGIGYGQLVVLIILNENPNITMAEITKIGNFDKATISKSIQKLSKEGFVKFEAQENDRRSKKIILTQKAKTLISDIYSIRKDFTNIITKNMTIKEIEMMSILFDKMLQNLEEISVQEEFAENEFPEFYAWNKVSMIDYPGHAACTLYTGGCNMKCPFCHNKELVFLSEDTLSIPDDEIGSYLKKRIGLLDGICISGGEPLLHKNMVPFIREIKKLGYKVKLDHNGTRPKVLEYLLEQNLLDYVAMDIKNAKRKYGETVGIKDFDIKPIEESIAILMGSKIPYEFRTTVVNELHTVADIEKIAKWIAGANKYTIQSFVGRASVIAGEGVFTSPSKEFIDACRKAAEKHIKNVSVVYAN